MIQGPASDLERAMLLIQRQQLFIDLLTAQYAQARVDLNLSRLLVDQLCQNIFRGELLNENTERGVHPPAVVDIICPGRSAA